MGKSGKVSFGGGGNGGFLGSGIFGHFGTVVNCSASDNSMYCTIMKLLNMLFVILVVSFIVYFVYIYVLKPAMSSRKR